MTHVENKNPLKRIKSVYRHQPSPPYRDPFFLGRESRASVKTQVNRVREFQDRRSGYVITIRKR